MFKLSTFIVLLATAVPAVAGVPHAAPAAPVDPESKTFRVRFRNIAYDQPMSGFLVSIHNRGATSLFELGLEATPQLATLAEDGDAMPLMQLVNATAGTNVDVSQLSINPFISEDGAPGPLFRGANNYVDVIVTTSTNFKLMSFASMAVNTNDCFVGGTDILLRDKLMITVPGYDAGSEENNELCSSVPGPACPMESGNVRSLNGEGVIGIHRGVHGRFEGNKKTDLPPDEYDWRNPMLLVQVDQMN